MSPCFALSLKRCLQLTTGNLKMPKVEKQSHQRRVRYWLWWMSTIFRRKDNSKFMRSFNSAVMFSSSWGLMGRPFNQDSPVNPLHHCVILWPGFIEWHHLSGNLFHFAGGLKCMASIYIVQRKNDASVNVTVCRETTTAAKIEMRRSFSVSTVINPISAGFWCWHR